MPQLSVLFKGPERDSMYMMVTLTLRALIKAFEDPLGNNQVSIAEVFEETRKKGLATPQDYYSVEHFLGVLERNLPVSIKYTDEGQLYLKIDPEQGIDGWVFEIVDPPEKVTRILKAGMPRIRKEKVEGPQNGRKGRCSRHRLNSTKTGGVDIDQLCIQRDTLQEELNQLRSEYVTLQASHQAALQRVPGLLKDLKKRSLRMGFERLGSSTNQRHRRNKKNLAKQRFKLESKLAKSREGSDVAGTRSKLIEELDLLKKHQSEVSDLLHWQNVSCSAAFQQLRQTQDQIYNESLRNPEVKQLLERADPYHLQALACKIDRKKEALADCQQRINRLTQA